MVLRPTAVPPSVHATVAAWDAVLPTQQQPCHACWLITQPDHASLAGDIAARLQGPWFPAMDEPVLRGISLHDQGWAAFDQRALVASNTPRSFVDESPATFVEAWTGSIEDCAAVAPIAGMIASKHFCRLASLRCDHVRDDDADRRRISGFVAAEEARQKELSGMCSGYDVEGLTDVLQFCDVLSLYLCCGSVADVAFPQEFGGARIRLERVRTGDEAAICRFTPAIFGAGTELAVAARRWPPSNDSRRFLAILQ